MLRSSSCRPRSGFGYLEVEDLDVGNLSIKKFIEKPEMEIASSLIKDKIIFGTRAFIVFVYLRCCAKLSLLTRAMKFYERISQMGFRMNERGQR